MAKQPILYSSEVLELAVQMKERIHTWKTEETRRKFVTNKSFICSQGEIYVDERAKITVSPYYKLKAS